MDVTGHMSGLDEEAAGRSGTRRSKTGAVSIRDVAKAAGVSYQTVSRVINDQAGVKPATRDSVEDWIRRLGFRPNQAARALARGRTRAVTVLTSNTTLHGCAATLQGIEEAARASGFPVGIRVLDSPDPAAIKATVEREIDPAGSVIVIAFDLAGVHALRAMPPGVALAAAVEASEATRRHSHPCVWVDDRTAAAEATRYLLELGHQTVHYVAIPYLTRVSDRAAGWRTALREAGIPVPRLVRGGWTPRSGYEAGRTLAADERVTAVLCGNDDLALGVLRAMREAGRDVPSDVSVVGFDDAPQSEFYAPALTTVRLDFVGLGRDCFRLLRTQHDTRDVGEGGRQEAQSEPSHAAPRLIVRASAAPPRSG
jgi:DNA-binding LacI/PurR family transcriptional regulator